MDVARPSNQSQSAFTPSVAAINALGEFLEVVMVIYLAFVALALPPAVAFLGLVALISTRLWTFLRALVWQALLNYISWISTIALFLFLGSTVKHVLVLVSLVFYGFMRSVLVLVVAIALPVGYVLLYAYLYAGIALAVVVLVVDQMIALYWAHPDIFVNLMMAILIILWELQWAWQWYWTHGSGPARLAEAEDDWTEEEGLGTIIREEFDVGMDAILAGGWEWWENFVWHNFLW